jgi:hypothetical protein
VILSLQSQLSSLELQLEIVQRALVMAAMEKEKANLSQFSPCLQEALLLMIVDLWTTRTQASSSASLSSEEKMASQLEEFGLWLVPKLDHLFTLTAAELEEFLKQHLASKSSS